MLLSTFELLLKPITPTPGTISGSDRGILQGYFLNISNPNNSNLRIRLRYNLTATSPPVNPSQLLPILDISGSNDFSIPLVADGLNRFRYDFVLNAGDTALAILQPDIRNLNPATDNLEVRGYVEVFFLLSFFPFPGSPPTRQLLVTPEHRGTFLPSPNESENEEFDQLIVSLPTSTGASLLNVDSIFNPIFETPTPIPNPLPQPTIPTGSVSNNNGSNIEQAETWQQILSVMAQKIDSLETRLSSEKT
ncbi:MAG: hypothetical protein AB4206_04075 [Xenococcaceae cyanobacterium]